jgi:1-acyl-sn-glycerol-3-phosphate acyltransferase
VFRRIYSTAFWVFLCVTCIVMFAGAAALFLLVAPFDRDRRAQHYYSCFWAQIFFYANPMWRCRVEGRHRIPHRGAAVLVSNHESLGDILVCFGLYRPFKWVSKASVFKVPLIGWNMWFNRYIPLVRRNRASVVAMMESCRTWLARDVPVLFFPEGTRSPDGEVKAFKDGAFQLALEVGCPVYPMVITGTANILPKHGYVIRENANCRLRVLEPIDPAQFDGDVARLRDHVRSVIVAERAAMMGQSAPVVDPEPEAAPVPGAEPAVMLQETSASAASESRVSRDVSRM